MFLKMLNDKVSKVIEIHRDKTLTWKLSGSEGGDYLVLISEGEIPAAIKVTIRLKEYWI